MTIKKLKLTEIRLDGNTQPRSRVYDETVSKYHEDLTEGAQFPAVEVFFDGKHYWLADGFHRYHAHRRAGYKEIEGQIHSGTRRDAFIFSRGANAEHGLPRTNEEKRSVVLSMLEDPEYDGEKAREIARICKVSNTLVSRIVKELELKNSSNKKMPPPPPAKPSLKPVVNEVNLDEEDRVVLLGERSRQRRLARRHLAAEEQQLTFRRHRSRPASHHTRVVPSRSRQPPPGSRRFLPHS